MRLALMRNVAADYSTYFAVYLHAPTVPWQASAQGGELVPLA